jgi:hypothetical protein
MARSEILIFMNVFSFLGRRNYGPARRGLNIARLAPAKLSCLFLQGSEKARARTTSALQLSI